MPDGTSMSDGAAWPEASTVSLERWRHVLAAASRHDALGYMRRLCPGPLRAVEFFQKLGAERDALWADLSRDEPSAERAARVRAELEPFLAEVASVACRQSRPGPDGEPVVHPRSAGTGPLTAEPRALSLLQDTSRRLLSQLDLRHLLPLLAERAAALAHAEAGFIALWDAESGALELVESHGLAAGAGGRLALEREALQAFLVDDRPRLATITSLPWLAGLGAHRALVAPLYYQGELLGVLGGVEPRGAEDAGERELLSLLAAQTTIALRNAASYREIIQKAQALRAANDQLLSLDRMKDEFLSVISHELRTPLNFITGFGSVLVDEADELTPDHRHYVEAMLNGGYQLLAIVDDLLDYSRIRAGRLSLRMDAFALDELLAEQLAHFRLQAEGKGVRLSLELAGAAWAVRGDRQRLGQVVSNLVANALKFTPPGGHVAIGARLEGGRVHVSVADTGPGIRSDQVAQLFQRFSQLDNSLTREGGGTGLGLAISKSLVEAHGGEIGVVSPVPAGAVGEPGVGSLFWFALPIGD